MEPTEPTVIVVLTPGGLEKAFVLYQEDDVEALEAGNRLLARVAAQLILLDNAVRRGEEASQ
jgi:hypothetical protein